MKFLILICVLTSFAYANPRKYSYVPTEKFRTNEIDDSIMHKDVVKTSDVKPSATSPEEKTREYWAEHGKKFIEEQVKKVPNTKQAKNIILFIGDGMSHSTVATTRVLLGNENIKLSFENFPYVASSKTYCVDDQVADSACSATAYLSGVKGNTMTIGVNANLKYRDCIDTNNRNKYTESIGLWAQHAKKATGLVTTTRITHASPAGVYAHTASRDWEDDSEVLHDKCQANTVEDIAMQLVHGETGSNLNVIFGGGSRGFIPSTENEHGQPGKRKDGRNLIKEWLNDKPKRSYIRNREELMNLKIDEAGDVLGMFHSSHLNYNLDTKRLKRENEDPTLTEMSIKAIDLLSKNENGYFLFIEGGRIDHGHHDTQAKYALDETVEFSKAIQAVVDKVNLDETLIVVSADHSHVFSYGGYEARGHDIFGLASDTALDGMRYFKLSYANGPGYKKHRVNNKRVDPLTLDTSKDDFEFPALVPLSSETHGGDDVGIWAIGPWAHMFQGTVEQSVIPHVMAFASCIGNGMKMCNINDYEI